MNTRVLQGPKHEPPVEVSFSVTPWRRLMGLFLWSRKGASGTWCPSPFPDSTRFTPRTGVFSRLLSVGPRTDLVVEWLVGIEILAWGVAFAAMGWYVYSAIQPRPGQRPAADADIMWVVIITTVVIAAIFTSAGVWMCMPLIGRLLLKKASRQRVAMVFGSQSEKLSDGQLAKPGIHLSGPEMTAYIPWSHVIGTSVGISQLWIVCLGRRLVDVPAHASTRQEGFADLLSLAERVEHAARQYTNERDHVLSRITSGGPKCPRCSCVLGGAIDKCPGCGVNVVDVTGGRGQLGGGDLRLMRQLWDTDMPA